MRRIGSKIVLHTHLQHNQHAFEHRLKHTAHSIVHRSCTERSWRSVSKSPPTDAPSLCRAARSAAHSVSQFTASGGRYRTCLVRCVPPTAFHRIGDDSSPLNLSHTSPVCTNGLQFIGLAKFARTTHTHSSRQRSVLK